MTLRGSAVFVTCILLSLAGCDTGEQVPVERQEFASEEERAVYEAFVQSWYGAFNRRDLEGLVLLYADDAIRMPHAQPALRGPEAIRSHLEGIFRTYSGLEVRGTSQEVRFLANWAVERGAYTYDARLAAADSAFRERGKYVILARKDETGVWKIVWEIWNANAPAPEPIEGDADGSPG